MTTEKYISELAQEKYSYSEFKKKVMEVYELTDMSFDLVTESTMNKWYHGSQTPKGVWLDILAKVLEVEKAELVEGKELPMLKHNIELEGKYEDSQVEKELINAILFIDKTNVTNVSLCLISIGLFYFFCIFSLEIFALVFLVLFICFMLKEAKSLNKEHDEFKKENKNVLIDVLKYIKDHRTVSSVLVHYIVTIVILAIIPLLEFIFYRGNFKISCTIYLIVGSMLYIISRKK